MVEQVHRIAHPPPSPRCLRCRRLSTETACWKKSGYAYVNVVLFAEKPIPLILPYLYDKAGQPGNTLQDWMFINNKGECSRHHVDALEEI